MGEVKSHFIAKNRTAGGWRALDKRSSWPYSSSRRTDVSLRYAVPSYEFNFAD